MSTILTERAESQVARPLHVLVPLIKQDFEAAEQAGMPYYRAAGAKLLEARDGSFEGRVADFYAWAEGHFARKQTQIRTYIRLVAAETNRAAAQPSYTTLDGFKRDIGHSRPTSGRIHREWQQPVDDIAERARRDAERIRDENLTRQQEREAEHGLALRLIEIGFKVLAKELHPDRGGSRDAMSRLNRVRDRLKQHA